MIDFRPQQNTTVMQQKVQQKKWKCNISQNKMIGTRI